MGRAERTDAHPPELRHPQEASPARQSPRSPYRRSAGSFAAAAGLTPGQSQETSDAGALDPSSPDSAIAPGLVFIWAFAFGLTMPFLTLTARDRGVSLDAIGLIAASFLLTQIIFQVPLGALSDRVGRAGPLVAGIALFSLATVGFTQADSAPAFMLLRAAQGVAFALGLPAYRALVADVTAPDQRGRAYATLGMAYSGGLLLGPAIGGLLVSSLGRDDLFLMTAVMEAALAAAGVLVFLRGAGRPGRRGTRGERVPLSSLFVRPLVAAFLLGFAGHIQYGFFESIWALYVADRGGGNVAIGLSFSTFAVANLALAPLGGRLADRGDYPHWLLVGFLGLAAVMVGYGLSPWVPAILLLGLCEGAAAAIAFPTLDAYLASRADPRIQGRIQGAFSSSMMAGAASSALGGSVLYRLAPGLPFVLGGATLAAVAIVAVGLIRGIARTAQSGMEAAPVSHGVAV
jgi:MFS family permease